jgi:hypothetical protein
MAVSIKEKSRLRFVDLLTVDDVVFWDLAVLPEIPEQSDDLLYQVRETDRIDRLATRFYGSPVLWWVIAVANDMEILPTDLDAADFIRIPSPRFILGDLFARERFQ